VSFFATGDNTLYSHLELLMPGSLQRHIRNALPRVTHFIRDERGAETLEWALICGLIIVATIVVIGNIGVKVLARWTSVNSSM
jgi:Flp pilus assembly pilin Flp